MSNTSLPRFGFDNSYARDLPGFYVRCEPARVPQPQLLFVHHGLAAELGIALDEHDGEQLAALFSGNALPEGAMPIAQAYAGHQFGHFSPRLGDGRALLVGEVIDRSGCRRDIAFKGSGRTPFSRNGDGKAAVGPMLREVIIGEAMHALGIPTTRALAVVATGVPVYRERALPGAVLTRVAASHLRVGTFEYFAAHGDTMQVRQLADYAISRHYPELTGSTQPYLDLLRAVAERQAALIARWMHAGFIHGVMNTDNMSISGETIDFGPCAFMEAYDPQTVFSSIDEGGRYAYGQQPVIAAWNLARFAEALLPLLAAEEEAAIDIATAVIQEFPARYRQYWLDGLRSKLGLQPSPAVADAEDHALGETWLNLLKDGQADFTLAWRRLADAAAGNDRLLRELLGGADGLPAWLVQWKQRCALDDLDKESATAGNERAEGMRQANPLVIPRNHLVEEALSAATDAADLQPFEDLLRAVTRPFEEAPEATRYAESATASFMAGFRTFCGT